MIVDINVEKLEPSYIASKIVKWCNAAVTLVNSLAVPQNVKHRITILSSNSTPRYIPKRNENISTQKPVHKCSQQRYQ